VKVCTDFTVSEIKAELAESKFNFKDISQINNFINFQYQTVIILITIVCLSAS
jgi:hypothetical protein